MSRPMLLVFLLIILIITSQFEWKQPLVSDVESNSSLTQKQHHISNAEETVKEKADQVLEMNCTLLICTGFHPVKSSRERILTRLIILVQEKNIRRLNELVRHLQEQLQQCKGSNGTINSTVVPLAERILEFERQQILED